MGYFHKEIRDGKWKVYSLTMVYMQEISVAKNSKCFLNIYKIEKNEKNSNFLKVWGCLDTKEEGKGGDYVHNCSFECHVFIPNKYKTLSRL